MKLKQLFKFCFNPVKMTSNTKFKCDFCQEKLVVQAQMRKHFEASTNKKCQPAYNTVKDLYAMFHDIIGIPGDPSANVMCRMCSRKLESLSIKLEEAKSIYKALPKAHPLTTDHTYHKTNENTGNQKIQR